MCFCIIGRCWERKKWCVLGSLEAVGIGRSDVFLHNWKVLGEEKVVCIGIIGSCEKYN